MKNLNIIALIFAVVLICITIIRWSSLDAIDLAINGLAIVGFTIMGIAPLFSKKK